MGITQKTEAVGMFSAEGEYVEFGHSVLLEGPVEVEFPSSFFFSSVVKFISVSRPNAYIVQITI